MKTIMMSLLVALFLSPAVFADDVADVKKNVTESVEFVLNTMKDDSIAKDERNDRIIKRLSPLFDFRAFADYCLQGYTKHSKKATSEQYAKYLELFEPHISRYYLGKLDLVLKSLKDQEIKVTVKDPVRKGKKYIIAKANVLLDGENIKMDFWFVKRNDAYKAFNIVIGKTNLGKAKRADFVVSIKNLGFDKLLEWLKDN